MIAFPFPQSHTPLLYLSTGLTQLQVFKLEDVLPLENIDKSHLTQLKLEPEPTTTDAAKSGHAQYP